MRLLLTIVGVLLIISGCVWFLQGINIIPGSFMTGQTKWSLYGAITVMAGIALILGGRRVTR